jgi:Protein of unknown function (DUF3306)
MTDPDNFLTRWSRRKRQAASESANESAPESREGDEPCAPEASSAERTSDAAAPAPVQIVKAETAEPAVDLSKLPPIESITAETDIRAFLAPGVPAELRLAALRRAWVADPKVRDFVGLADYDFDFHTPGAIPGFGPLEMTDELRREVLRMASAWQPEPDATPSTTTAPGIPLAQPTAAIEEINAPPPALRSIPTDQSGAGIEQPPCDQDEVTEAEATSHRNEDDAASQQEHSKPENLQTLARRGHGRALPK